jgi:hypothetical protein
MAGNTAVICPAYRGTVTRGTSESPLRLTVRQLLAAPEFRLRVVAGAAGLDRPVRWAHSTELLDPGPYLRGHEIVLTVGASLTGADRCDAFARSVHASRGSAIGYGIGDVTSAVPPALGAACDRLELPLFEVPREVPFVSFTEWLAERLAAARDEEHERQETGRLLDLVRSGLASSEVVRGRLQRCGVDTGLMLGAALPAPVLADPQGGGVLAGVMGDVALVVAAGEEPVLALAADGPCGIGSLGPLAHLASSLAEGLAGLDLARRRGGVVRAADLATFPALLGRLGQRQLAPFLDQIARPLASYDAAHGTRLIGTLRTFLGTGGSVSTASRELFLHVNTLRHRLARIQSVTGRDPFDFDDRVAFAVALWAWDREET